MSTVEPVTSAPILVRGKYQLFNDKGQLVGGSATYERAVELAAKPTLIGPRPIHIYVLVTDIP